MKFNSMSDVRYAFPLWFSPNTMRFFRSRIASELYAGKYFITSEQFVDGAYREPRKYTIREVTDTGINTVGEFNKIAALREARAMVRELVKKGV